MKIILVNNFISLKGGSEKYTIQLGEILKENGHEVFYFATDRDSFDNNFENIELFPKYFNFRNESKSKQIQNIFKLFYNMEAKKKLELLIKKVEPDIVHFNCINYHLTSSVIQICKKYKIPTLMTLHDIRFCCPGGTLLKGKKHYCEDQPCLQRTTLPCILNKCKNKNLFESIISATELYFVRFLGIYKNIDSFICPSEAIYNLAIKAGFEKTKLNILYNFLDKETSKIIPKYKDDNYFLYAGRLVEEKGINYLLEAMSKISNEIKLNIAGSGDQEKKLREMAQNMQLQNVNFLGFISEDNLKNTFENCIATILPCNYFEAFGLSIIESFAYGKPVIASNIGAISEIIDNGKNGVMFEVGDVDKLAEHIKELFYNRNKSNEMGINARVSIQKYNPNNYYNELIALYNNLI